MSRTCSQGVTKPEFRLSGAQPNQYGPGDIVLPNDRVMAAQPAQFALDEIGMHGIGGSLQKCGALFVIGGGQAQPGKAVLGLPPGAAKCRRLLGQDLVAEQVQARFDGQPRKLR